MLNENYTLSEAAEQLGVSVQTVRTYVREGKLSCVHVGGKRYITPQQLDAAKQHGNSKPGDMLSIAETAQQLGVTQQTVRNYIARNYLRCVKFGNRTRVPAFEVKRFKVYGDYDSSSVSLDTLSTDEQEGGPKLTLQERAAHTFDRYMKKFGPLAIFEKMPRLIYEALARDVYKPGAVLYLAHLARKVLAEEAIFADIAANSNEYAECKTIDDCLAAMNAESLASLQEFCRKNGLPIPKSLASLQNCSNLYSLPAEQLAEQDERQDV